jgi:UDP:flavonoid glycosyltransferase YjiC (YdhE family)
VGTYLYPKAFTPVRVAAALTRLTRSSEVAQACSACRARVKAQMSPEAVFHILEETHRRACG